jgi:catechol 2,3-dioxygenase-like lactoylglutathione lyase family enzyme
VVESDYLSQVVGYPDAKLHIVYLGLGDLKHSVELIQYLRPEGDGVAPVPRNYVDATYKEISSRGVKFVSAPAVRPNAQYPWAQKACYLEDPDGNWLEFIEREPPPPDARVS